MKLPEIVISALLTTESLREYSLAMTMRGYLLPQYYARRYRVLGWSVVPCEDRSKRPSIPWAEYQHRLPTYEEIDNWRWDNIGIITGRVSGIVVIDEDDLSSLDPKDRLKAEHFLERLPITATVITGKGRHRYFLLPGARKPFDPREDPDVDNSQPSERLPIIPRKIRFLPGLDCCGEGGLVIAPPSIHPSGKLYVWDDNRDPEHILAYLPDWAVQIICREEEKAQKIWQYAVDGVAEGYRNSSAASYIGYLIHDKDPSTFPDLWAAVVKWNEKNNPPLSLKELKTIFQSVCKREYLRQQSIAPLPRSTVSQPIALPEHVDVAQLVERADTLFHAHIRIIPQAIEGILPAGLVILAGKPKVGKSRLALQLAMAVSHGITPFDTALLHKHHIPGAIDKGKVIYLALEDSRRRMQERMKHLMEVLHLGQPSPDLWFLYEFPALIEGGLARMQRIVETTPELRMIVVDTMTAFTMGSETQRENAFFREYRMIQPLQELAKDRRLTILLVAHAGKDKAHIQDWQDALSGTLGTSAAADAILLLAEERKHRNAPKHIVLHGKGRDIEGFDLPLIPNAVGWAIGTAMPSASPP